MDNKHKRRAPGPGAPSSNSTRGSELASPERPRSTTVPPAPTPVGRTPHGRPNLNQPLKRAPSGQLHTGPGGGAQDKVDAAPGESDAADSTGPGHNWCTAAPCTMAWFIGIAMHLHLGASQLPGTVLHRAPRCIRPLRHPHRGACQPYCTECAPAPRCIPALLNVSLTLGQHCNSTKKTSEVKY